MSRQLGRGFTVSLAGLAGFVDAMGYQSLGHFFVGFMSGNSTKLGIGLADVASRPIWLAGVLVASFVVGVAGGTLFGQVNDIPHRVERLLTLVATLLAAAAALNQFGLVVVPGILMAMAMGAENTVSHGKGQSGIGLTYMTGTLVRVGQKLAGAIGGHGWAAILPDLSLWLGMVAGAVLGGLSFGLLGLDGLWIAVAATLVMAATAWRVTERHAALTAADAARDAGA